MAQYLLSVWHDSDYELDFSSDDAQRQMAQVGQFNAELAAAGALVFAAGLQPAGTAVVFGRDGDGAVRSDGPYVSGAQVGGFWIVESADEPSGIEWGRRAAVACERPVEVRRLQG